MGTAYLGVAPTLGAVQGTLYAVEGENYDMGGEGVAFHDTTPGNSFGAYRTGSGDSVDVEDAYNNSCNDISDIAPGEWTKYTVTIATAGTYKVQLGAASASARNMHIEIDGVNVTGPLVVNTGGATVFKNIDQTVAFTMSTGTHVVTFAFDDGFMALNWVKFYRP
jgi:Carbohydrate binding module (family 35)